MHLNLFPFLDLANVHSYPVCSHQQRSLPLEESSTFFTSTNFYYGREIITCFEEKKSQGVFFFNHLLFSCHWGTFLTHPLEGFRVLGKPVAPSFLSYCCRNVFIQLLRAHPGKAGKLVSNVLVLEKLEIISSLYHPMTTCGWFRRFAHA